MLVIVLVVVVIATADFADFSDFLIATDLCITRICTAILLSHVVVIQALVSLNLNIFCLQLLKEEKPIYHPA